MFELVKRSGQYHVIKEGGIAIVASHQWDKGQRKMYLMDKTTEKDYKDTKMMERGLMISTN